MDSKGKGGGGNMIREDKVGCAIKYCAEKLFDDSCHGKSWSWSRPHGYRGPLFFRSYREDMGVHIGFRLLWGENIYFYNHKNNFVFRHHGCTSVIYLCDYFNDPLCPQEQEIILFSIIHPDISSILELVGGVI